LSWRPRSRKMASLSGLVIHDPSPFRLVWYENPWRSAWAVDIIQTWWLSRTVNEDDRAGRNGLRLSLGVESGSDCRSDCRWIRTLAKVSAKDTDRLAFWPGDAAGAPWCVSFSAFTWIVGAGGDRYRGTVGTVVTVAVVASGIAAPDVRGSVTHVLRGTTGCRRIVVISWAAVGSVSVLWKTDRRTFFGVGSLIAAWRR
jgi:hypothetical protein